MRGAFIRSDGLEIPNNLTDLGLQEILNRSMRNQLGFNGLWIAFVDAIWEPDLLIEDLAEPTIGVGDYARQPLTNRSTLDWPTMGETGGIPYIETKTIQFIANAAWDQQVTRLAIVDSLNGLTGNVFALGSVLPYALDVDGNTSDELLRFKYRLYGR